MFRGLFILFILFVAGFSSLSEAAQTVGESSPLLKRRELIATIPFEHNDYRLSKSICQELEKQFSNALAKSGSRGIIRLEGFAAQDEVVGGKDGVAQLRAKEAWIYLRKRNEKFKERMFMTWFDQTNSLTQTTGGRLEIAVYDNPFAAELDRSDKFEGR